MAAVVTITAARTRSKHLVILYCNKTVSESNFQNQKDTKELEAIVNRWEVASIYTIQVLHYGLHNGYDFIVSEACEVGYFIRQFPSPAFVEFLTPYAVARRGGSCTCYMYLYAFLCMQTD